MFSLAEFLWSARICPRNGPQGDKSICQKKFVVAPIGKRFSAQFIDEVLAFGVAYAVMLSLRETLPENGLILVFILILAVYMLFADGLFNGQSVGKKIMGLYVVHYETEAPCGFGRSFVRNIAYMGASLILFFSFFATTEDVSVI